METSNMSLRPTFKDVWGSDTNILPLNVIALRVLN